MRSQKVYSGNVSIEIWDAVIDMRKIKKIPEGVEVKYDSEGKVQHLEIDSLAVGSLRKVVKWLSSILVEGEITIDDHEENVLYYAEPGRWGTYNGYVLLKDYESAIVVPTNLLRSFAKAIGAKRDDEVKEFIIEWMRSIVEV